ncbi:phosphodiesterase [Halopseudomonas sp.]|uniref:phosphodiesterase n=1 Tax=Halopseudomonas sp. TaxID=2901191 RepID=UPI003FA5F275
MKKMTSTLVATTLALGVSFMTPVQAETLVIPLGQQTAERSDPMPHRGLTKSAVTQRYGEPMTRHPAVGQPPITRWDYASYSVYFEYDRVIDSVRHRQGRSTPAP